MWYVTHSNTCLMFIANWRWPIEAETCRHHVYLFGISSSFNKVDENSGTEYTERRGSVLHNIYILFMIRDITRATCFDPARFSSGPYRYIYIIWGKITYVIWQRLKIYRNIILFCSILLRYNFRHSHITHMWFCLRLYKCISKGLRMTLRGRNMSP
jgi:hypothetical protein